MHVMSKSKREHLHHYYTFGAAVNKKLTEISSSICCQSDEDKDLIGGGKDCCIFVTKATIKYAASSTSSYPIPPIKNVQKSLFDATTTSMISDTDLQHVLDFTVETQLTEAIPPATKRVKIQLQDETSKNEVMCYSLQQILQKVDVRIQVDRGQMDEVPSPYSPFHRSRSDLFMYHKDFYKKKMITSVVASNGKEDDDDDDSDGGGRGDICVGSVCEMKNNKRAKHQLIANMVHFGTQITVKALKEGSIVDVCTIYGMAINYKERNARLMKLVMNFEKVETYVEDNGVFPLINIFNYIINKLTED